MNLIQQLSTDVKETIRYCWKQDVDIQKFSRNSQHNLSNRVEKEVEFLKQTNNFEFYRIMDDLSFVGYFGKEGKCLTTFFIMPEYRNNKNDVWKFISSNFKDEFFAGLFKVNTRAIKFFQNQGGVQIAETVAENKPVVIFKFEVV